VVDDSERLFRRTDLAAGHAQTFEGLRTRHFVNEVTVDVEKTGAVVLFVDQVIIPDLVIEGTRCAHGGISIEFSKKVGKPAARRPEALIRRSG
jgi:hypothetical protein